jgi:hypothetical protein
MSKETKLNPVVLLVAEKSSYLSRSLPGLFSAANAYVVFASPESCSVRFSVHINEVVTYDTNQPDAIQVLENLVCQFRPSLLIVISERFVEKLIALPPEVAPQTRMLLDLDDRFLSRASFQSWATLQGIPMPAGVICHTAEEAESSLAQYGSVFLKQNNSSGGDGVRNAMSRQELDLAFAELLTDEGILVQEAIDGIVGVTDMIVSHGDLRAWNSSEKWRTTRRFGPSISRRLCRPAGMEDLARQVAKETGFHGLCGFDWVISHEDKQPRLIEFHPRPPSGFGLGKWAGVDFSKAAASLIGTGEVCYQAPNQLTAHSKSICCYFPDHPLVSIKRHEWRELLHWLPFTQSRSWSLLPWGDLTLLTKMLGKHLN